MITISIFTRGKNEKLDNLVSDIRNQSFSDFKIKIYSDNFFDNSDVIVSKGNISKKRNQAINECETKYLFLLDDDNRIYDNNFLEKLINNYKNIENKEGECIVSPTIYWRDTNIIQSAGIRFCFILGKVFSNKKIKGEYWESKGIGGNSLFGKLEYFKKSKFDEDIGFIREDIDYSYSLRENGVKIFLLNLKINHQERDKTELEKSFIQGDIFYKKIKNRNIFVKKHGNILQKIAYWLIGYWISILIWQIKRWKK